MGMRGKPGLGVTRNLHAGSKEVLISSQEWPLQCKEKGAPFSLQAKDHGSSGGCEIEHGARSF